MTDDSTATKIVVNPNVPAAPGPNAVQTFWTWLSGKKRTIALVYWTVVIPVMQVLYPNGAPATTNKVIAIIGIVLSAVGLGHAAYKSYNQE